MPDDASAAHETAVETAPAPVLAPALQHVRRVEAVVNPLSGSVGPHAAAELEARLAAWGFDARVYAPEPAGLGEALAEAVARRPDLLVVLAGDGTARLACQLAGAEGPPVLPLPGGTMNMLPFALLGRRPWPEALEAALTHGELKPVSGGEVDGELFFCAAIVGAPALWQPAREAVRKGHFRRAYRAARVALGRAFARHVRYRLDGGPEQKARALSLMCPLVSRVMTDDAALDVAALNPRGPGDALRLGARTLLTDILGDWRLDPAVEARQAREVRVRGRRWRVPAVLDGEAQRLRRGATIRFHPAAFHAVSVPEVDAAAAAAPERRAHEAAAAADVAVSEAAGVAGA